jgi:hypothetical protein
MALLIGDQRQCCREIEHRLRQGNPQEQAHLGDAEREGGVRVQAGHLIWCGQGTSGRRAQDPPLSGSGVGAIEPGNDERG